MCLKCFVYDFESPMLHASGSIERFQSFFLWKRLSVKKVLSEIMVDFPDKICYYAGDIHEK